MELRIVNDTKYPMSHILTEINKNIFVETLEEKEDFEIETYYGLILNVYKNKNYALVVASSNSDNWKQDLV